MNREEIIEFLKAEKIILDTNKISAHVIRKTKARPHLNIMLNSITQHLNDNACCTERVYHIINNINQKITCKMCNNQVKFNSSAANNPNKVYNVYCSRDCKIKYSVESGNSKLVYEKMLEARLKIGEDGLNSFQRCGVNTEKILESKRNNIDENGLNSFQRSNKHYLKMMEETIDPITGLTKRQLCTLKIKKTKTEIGEDGLNSAQRTARKKSLQDKRRKTNEENYSWIPLEEKSEFKLYRRLVTIETNKQPIKLLENYELWGKYSYNLDHIYSVYYGFKNKIPPEIIGNIVNLRFITENENCSKHTRCDITIEELYKKYEELLKNNS